MPDEPKSFLSAQRNNAKTTLSNFSTDHRFERSMHMHIAIALRIYFHFGLFLLALPVAAHASLPISSCVPGGVAIVPLGDVSARASTPQSWLGDQPVLVTSRQGRWYAVVGLPLDMVPGSYELRVNLDDVTTMQSFAVSPKDYPQQHITLKDKGKVQPSEANLARVETEIAVIKELKRHWRTVPDADLAFILPAEGRRSGNFGLRRFFNGEPRASHAGIDVAIARGTPVRASAQGRVLAVDDYFFNGKTIFVDHGNGLITMYCHLDRIDVEAGDAIGKGEQIGLSGKTGRATGPHLHWSVILNGAMVDPELFLTASSGGAGK